MAEPICYVYIDDLVEFAQSNRAVTGIQRVAIEIIKGLRQRFGGDGVRLLSQRHARGFVVYSSELFEPEWVYDQAEFCHFFSTPPRCGEDAGIAVEDLLSLKYRGVKLSYKLALLRARNFLSRGATFRRLGVGARRDGAHYLRARRFDLQFSPEDIVYIPGEFWSRPIEKLIEAFEAAPQPPRLALYIHDLIPLVAPHLTGRDFNRPYRAKLDLLLKYTTKIIANSHYTAGDVRRMLDLSGRDGRLDPVAVAPLAHEFIGDETTLDEYERGALEFVTRLPYVLMVGCANPRKNAWAAAKVWQKLGADLGLRAPRLIFVDRHIFLDQNFRRLMEQTACLGGLAETIEAPSDAQLAFLYRHCLFTIYPSLYEGWGLPVGESLWFGKAVAAARATSLPEVGGDLAEYFDPTDLQAFYDVCARLILDHDHRRDRESRIAQASLRSWAQAIAETADAVAAPP